MQEARAAVDVYFEMICIKFLPGDPWETGEDECNNNELRVVDGRRRRRRMRWRRKRRVACSVFRQRPLHKSSQILLTPVFWQQRGTIDGGTSLISRAAFQKWPWPFAYSLLGRSKSYKLSSKDRI